VDGGAMNLNDRHKSNVFNKYFGGSMSGLVFQEIREFKSLAYSAWGSYRSPHYLDDSGRFEGFMGTQADKTIDAIDTYVRLLTEMPEKPLRTDGIRSGLLESLNSFKPRFRYMGLRIRGWENQGYVTDPRKTKKDVYEEVKFDDIAEFYSTFIKGKPITITIVGNKDKIEMEKLSKFGEVIEVKKEDIFN
jgi:predicted Zn-dependent peptidase